MKIEGCVLNYREKSKDDRREKRKKERKRGGESGWGDVGGNGERKVGVPEIYRAKCLNIHIFVAHSIHHPHLS